MRSLINPLCFAPIAVIMFVPLFAPAFGAGQPPRAAYTDPQAIDQAVLAFTGVSIGEIGGARVPTDRRLRLSYCRSPLAASWHGNAKSTVKVECPEPGGWRIFVGIKPAPRAQVAKRVIRRGDPITVMVRGRGFTVQQSGEAMDNGSVGDWIAIRTARQAEPIRARIERPGLAIIPAS